MQYAKEKDIVNLNGYVLKEIKNKTRQGAQEVQFINGVIGVTLIGKEIFEFFSSSVLSLLTSAVIPLFRRGGGNNKEPLYWIFGQVSLCFRACITNYGGGGAEYPGRIYYLLSFFRHIHN